MARGSGLMKEFRDFLMRGNIVELAIAVVIGTAFAALVKALVDNLLTPLIAAIFGEPDFSALSFTINESVFTYGVFINALITFVAVAAAVFFFVVKPLNALAARRKKGEEPPAEPSDDVKLLMEIRDLLRERQP
ncbi:MAG: large conductance mechanosensitive channel protein MscL [Thermoleophilia bacterium]